MTDLEGLDCAVIPDSHGEDEKVARVIDALESVVDKFLLLGDVFDKGPNTRKLLRLIRDLGDRAITVAGNHEWACRNALAVDDSPETDIWRTEIWPGYENQMLESYGLKRTADWQLNAAQLREVMAESGDLDWLMCLPPYIETSEFIAVHAGPVLTAAWSEQAKYLDYASSDGVRQTEEPEQIFSSDLAALIDVPASVDQRIFVTGHNHLTLPSGARMLGRRICLASKLTDGEPLFVWHSGENTIYRY